MALQGAFPRSPRLPCSRVPTPNVIIPSCLGRSARCGLARVARTRGCAVQATLGNSRTTVLDETASALAESEDGYLSEQTRREAVATYDDDPAAARNPGMPQVAFVSLADGVFTVRGSLRLDISPDAIYELLTDYASCQRVFKNIASSEVIHTEAGLEVIQNCKWNFLAFSGTFKVHLGVQEDAAARSLLFTLVESSFMRSFKGSWIVKEAPSSSSSSGSGRVGCLIEHQLSVAPSVPVPPPVSYYTRGIFMRQVERVLLDLKEEAEARWGRGAEAVGVEVERVAVKVGSG